MKPIVELTAIALAAAGPLLAAASDTPPPTSVTVAGSFQSEAGCPTDWDPACPATALVFDAQDGVWQLTLTLPAGTWEYKAALNGTWDENYGAGAARDGANLSFSIATPSAVKFYYDHETHWITDSASSVIAVVAGSFQSELGCAGDWDPGCLRSWLQDPDGDGTYAFQALLPAGSYEAKVAISESWTENYGAAGVPNGPNIAFVVADASVPVLFQYDAATHVLTIGGGGAAPPTYAFTGFFPPIANPPAVNPVKAGQVVALKFRLGGDRGRDVFWAGSPTSVQRQCPSTPIAGAVEEPVAATLGYDATHDQYVLRWRTDRRWAGTCRELLMKLADGSLHTALLDFRR